MKGRLITGATLLVVGGGIYLLTRPDKIEVTLATVERGSVESTVANTRAGTVEACQRSKLSLPIGGQIDEILVEEGEHVAENDLLISLWNLDRKARVAEAQAALNSSGRERDSLCVTAASDLKESRRFIRLADRDLVSEETADLAQSKAEASAARCEAARAKVLQAEASLDVARANLAQTELRAPFAGIVAEVTGKIGEYSTPSPPGVPTPPAIDLITDDCHYVSAPIDEVDAAQIAVGLPVRITLDAYRDRSFPATVTRIAPYVLDLEKQARTVEVEAEFTGLPSDVRLLAGYSADMEIILETREDAVRIPSELVLDNRHVLVVNGRGRLEKREIEMGLSNWRFTEVVAGLAPGDEVVANVGTAGVVDGAAVTVSEPGAGNGDD